MKAIVLFFLLPCSALPAAGLDMMRALLKEDPGQAAAKLTQSLAYRPEDPWRLYNAGVASYAAEDFATADERWQKLATLKLPEALRDMTWMQIGNVSYRLAEPQIESAPDAALPRLEQAREAFKTALSYNEKNRKARQNLLFVESLLEKLYARLAQQLAQAAATERELEQKIQQLEAALSYARQAEALNPENETRREERQAIGRALAEALNERATREERYADARRADRSDEARAEAREHYGQALDDFRDAQRHEPANAIAMEGEARVREKLADMLTERGQEHLAEGEQAREDRRSDDAIGEFQQALENFQEALGTQPEHAEAQAGEIAARAALEERHLAVGDRQARDGEALAERFPAEAADQLGQALEHFQQAREVAPGNETIPPRIEKTEALLAGLLEAMAREQMQAAGQAEQQQEVAEAISQYEQAEGNFGRTGELQPGNDAARQGQEEAREALARLRRPSSPSRFSPGEISASGASFQRLLQDFKAEQQWYDEQRSSRRDDVRYRENKRPNLRDW